MILRILYRSVGSENSKNRPEFYSKQLALASLLRAAENVGVPTRIVFVNDGPIPADRLSMMSAAGEVLPVTCGSNRASYRHILRLPRVRRWAAEDLVWLAEDDYLYTERSLSALVAAAAARPDADYFTLYSTVRFSPDSTRRRPRVEQSTGVTSGLTHIDGIAWARAATTTSTFGVRVGTLLQDELLLRTTPFVGGAFDRATCLALQGFQPFRLETLGGEPPKVEPPTAARRLARRAALTTVRATLNAVALSRPERRRRSMIVPEPSMATHLELDGAMVPGHDWAAEAEVVRTWLHARTVAAATADAARAGGRRGAPTGPGRTISDQPTPATPFPTNPAPGVAGVSRGSSVA
ncbi:hypothetical protein [Frankia sp. AgB32]|uniref:hypothetical protein n=1 Tax=Frankia sp. AgB32 TaxID=631119 RepID=UPI00200DAB09|nr:hypothetical protein [Frankia sp. AgB32]MCK9897164.1 hypothetical protein [Frankia sp. AgB32]